MKKPTILAIFMCMSLLFCSCESSSPETAENILPETENSTSLTTEAVETTIATTTEIQTTTEATTTKAVSVTTQKYTSNSPTTGEKNALKTALDYLDAMPFSYNGLIDQLEYEGYTYSEAVYGADNCGADWNKQAEQCAANYLAVMPFSRQGLIEQLEYEGFTNEQAVHGADASLNDTSKDISSSFSSGSPTTGEKNALKTAQNYLDFMPFSYSGLIDQLEYEGYTHSEAVYGADNCGADWNKQAEKCAANYLAFMSFSRQELIEQLEYEGFTNSQAVHGVEANGY